MILNRVGAVLLGIAALTGLSFGHDLTLNKLSQELGPQLNITFDHITGVSKTLRENEVFTNDIKFKGKVDYKSARHVTCRGATGWSYGTVTKIGEKSYISAYHVFQNKAFCRDTFTQVEYKVVQIDRDNDFVILTSDIDQGGKPFKYSCEPFVKGEKYNSIGYGTGLILMNSKGVATGEITDETDTVMTPWGIRSIPLMDKLNGLLIPGASGGPIVDKKGVIKGLNNVTNIPNRIMMSYSLSRTPLCK